MKTLVLNVDRDDDFGRKAKVKSPIVGVKNNINAANKLGQVDPEDSDLNAIFSAISTYNKLKEDGRKVEIATICGNIHVGYKSDEILSKQLEDVIKKTEADEVILLSDGAEDEYIIPIVQSRIKITSIKRVSVKQSKELEDTYYRIIKLLSDEKVQKQFFLPIALVFLVWGIFFYADMTRAGFGTILLVLGAYLLIRIYRLEKNIAFVCNEIKSGFLTGKLSIFTHPLAIIILIAFIFVAFRGLEDLNYNPNIYLIPLSYFIANTIWGFIIAGLLIIFGRSVDVYVRDKKAPWNYFAFPFMLFSMGFIVYAISESLYDSTQATSTISWEYFLEVSFVGFLFVGILTAIVGAIIYHFAKDIYSIKEKEMEVEKQTKELAEN